MTHLPIRLPFPAAARSPRRDVVLWLAGAAALSLLCGLLVSAKPMAMIGLAVFAVASYGFLRHPLVTLGVIVAVRASVPEYPQLATLIAGAGGLALLLGRHGLRRRPYVLSLGALILLGAASYTWSVTPTETVAQVQRFTALLVLLCTAIVATKDVRDLRRVMACILAGAIVPVAVGLIQLANGDYDEREGVFAILGTFDFANGYALFLSLILLLAPVAVSQVRQLAPRVAGAAFIGLAGLCFFLTYSRIVWIGLVLAIAVLAVVQYRKLIGVAALGVVIVIVATPSTVLKVQDRFSDLSPSSADYRSNSLSWRLENWKRMAPYGNEKPLVGWGLGSYKDLTLVEFGGVDKTWSDPPETPTGGPTGVSAHNDYMKLYVELGLVGVGLWLGTLVALCVALWRARAHPKVRPWAGVMFAYMVALVIMSIGDTQQDYRAGMYYIVIAAGAVIGAARAVPAVTRPLVRDA